MEKDREERSIQLSRYKRAKAMELEELCNGPHGVGFTALVKMLKSLTMDDADELATDILSKRWIIADDEVRAAVLSLIGDAIIRLRIRHGLAPFDDSIEPEAPTVFQVLRHHLTGV